MNEYNDNYDDLNRRMEIIDEKREERRKCVLEEYNSTKNSPQYIQKKAYKKLRKIVQGIENVEDFLTYLESQIQELSIDEYMALEAIFHYLRVLREKFEEMQKK